MFLQNQCHPVTVGFNVYLKSSCPNAWMLLQLGCKTATTAADTEFIIFKQCK